MTNAKPQRLKLILNSKPPSSDVDDAAFPHPNDVDGPGSEDNEDDDDATLPTIGSPSPMPDDLNFTEAELALPPSQLFRYLRRQAHWAEQAGLTLKAECEALNAKRIQEWQRKELVLVNYIEGTLAIAARNGEDHSKVEQMCHDLLPPLLPIHGKQPWFRTGETVESEEVRRGELTREITKGEEVKEERTRKKVGKWVEALGHADSESGIS